MSNKQVKIGAVLSYVSIGINILAALIYTPWMINQIGESQYGLYTLVNSLITLFMVDFGLGSAVGRYLSKYRAENKEEEIEKFLGMVYKLYFVIDLIILLILTVVYFFLPNIYVKLTAEEIEQLKGVYIIAATVSVLNFPFLTFNGILTAYEKFIQLKLADVLTRILTVGLTVAALLEGKGLYALVLVHAVSGLMITLYKFLVIQRTTNVKVNLQYFDRDLCKDIFGFSVWVTMATLGQRLIFNITPSILGVVTDSSAIAVFGVVTSLESNVYLVTTAINGMFMPKISRIYANGNGNKDIMPLMLKVGKFQFALNSLIVVVFAVIGKEFISLWMGENYIGAYYGTLLVIIPGLFFNSLQIANTAIIVTKKVYIQAYITLFIGVFNVICSYFLSGKYGMLGACVSIFLAYSLRVVLYNIAFYKSMKLDILCFIKKCYLRMLCPLIFTVVLSGFMVLAIDTSSWLSLIFKAGICCTCYVIFALLLGLNKDERKVLLNKFRKNNATNEVYYE